MSGGEPAPYWRDVGTIDAFWRANIDLTDFVPQLDIYHQEWPIWTYSEVTPPAKFIHDQPDRRGSAVSSMVSGGCIISGSHISQCLLFTGVHTHSYSVLRGVVALPRVVVNRHARLTERRHRPRRVDPGGTRRRRESRRGREMVSANRKRRLPDHAADGGALAGRKIAVLFVVSECAPLVKTGGLADVAGALPRALAPARLRASAC